ASAAPHKRSGGRVRQKPRDASSSQELDPDRGPRRPNRQTRRNRPKPNRRVAAVDRQGSWSQVSILRSQGAQQPTRVALEDDLLLAGERLAHFGQLFGADRQ